MMHSSSAVNGISRTDAYGLIRATDSDLMGLLREASRIRDARTGQVIAYSRKVFIPLTNLCRDRCGYCTLAREPGDPVAHTMKPEEVLAGARAGRKAGCKEALFSLGDKPELRFHVRNIISPGRISTGDWVEVVRAAHGLGIPATVTIMYGHVETALDRARHLDLIRGIQKEANGFTEFVPLSFIAVEAPIFKKSLIPGIPARVRDEDVLRTYAVSRLMLDPWIPNSQASWVKPGPHLAQCCLNAGANDFGGTLMNEGISTSAGAPHGQFLHPAEMGRWIRGAGRIPVQRWTTYQNLRSFEQEPPEPEVCWNDNRFGSYAQLIASQEFRFRDRGDYRV